MQNADPYVQSVLEAYRSTPGTCGVVRKNDRAFALQLHQRGIPLAIVENALVLAAARRLARPAGSPPLGQIRSMAYFAPVIEEILASNPGDAYFQHLRRRLTQLLTPH